MFLRRVFQCQPFTSPRSSLGVANKLVSHEKHDAIILIVAFGKLGFFTVVGNEYIPT